MNNLELYDKRFDWLAPSLLALPLIWFFYGNSATAAAAVFFVLIGALKPIRARLTANISPGLFAAGATLLLSPSLRILFYDGYCYEGPGSPAFGIYSAEDWPDACTRTFFGYVGLDVWKGPLRDIVMPLAGLSLILIALSSLKRVATQSTGDVPDDNYNYQPLLKVRLFGWLVLALTIAAGIGASFLNHQNDLKVAEEERKAAVAQRLKEEQAEKAALANRLEKERLAKQVTQQWLLGSWVSKENISPDIMYRPDIYCSTDTGVTFNSDGEYSWGGDEGRYALSDGQLRLTDSIRYDIGGSDPPQSIKASTSKVFRDGEHLVIDGKKYSRC